jgi:hypothetical protein
MKIGKKFNQLSLKEYIFIINNHKKYTDFNVLGLYRSIIENHKLSLDEKKIIKNNADVFFKKTFDFLQIKDPITYFKLSTLGLSLTQADENEIWDDIKRYQEKTLSQKRIKHRNFGYYSKHNCGIITCPYNGIMIKQGSILSECKMTFGSDREKRDKKHSKKEKHDWMEF